MSSSRARNFLLRRSFPMPPAMPSTSYIFTLQVSQGPAQLFFAMSKIVRPLRRFPAHQMRLSGELTTEPDAETHCEGEGPGIWEPRPGTEYNAALCLPWRWDPGLKSRCLAFYMRFCAGESLSASSDRSFAFPGAPIPVVALPCEMHAVARHDNALAAREAWYSACTPPLSERMSTSATYQGLETHREGVHFSGGGFHF
jgi:hypothetical protein